MTDKAALGQIVPKSPGLTEGLFLMDGIEGLRSLPRHSVDMLLTDPPYGTTRNFWDVPLPLPGIMGGGKMVRSSRRARCCSLLNAPMTRCWGPPTSPCSAMSGSGTRSAGRDFSMQTGPR